MSGEWEEAFAQNGFDPGFLDEFPGLHLTMLRDHLEGLADSEYGAGRWVRRDEKIELFEPPSRAEDDEDRYFRMTAWFRPKVEGE